MYSELDSILECNIEYTSNPEEADGITHNGNAHLDENACNVFFGKTSKKWIVYRSGRKLPSPEKRNPNAYIYDIGGGELDHHQKNGNGCHPCNSSELLPIPYASFGLVWKKFGRNFCDKIAKVYGNPELSPFLWDWMEKNLVINIDAADSGVYFGSPSSYACYPILTISNMITLFNPLPSEEQDYESALVPMTELTSLIFDTILKKGIWEFEHPISDEIYSQKEIPLQAHETDSQKETPLQAHEINSKKSTPLQAHEIFQEVILKHIFPNASQEQLKKLSSMEDNDIYYHTLNFPVSISEKEPIPTTSLGVIWEKYGRLYCKSFFSDKESAEELWNFIKTELILCIDAYANKIYPVFDSRYVTYKYLTISNLIEELTPLEYSESAYTEAKETALFWANAIFERLITKGLDLIRSRPYVEAQIESSKNHILILDHFVHWQYCLSRSTNLKAKDLWFVIFPSNKGDYNIQPIRSKYSQNGYRKGFPKEWYGCEDEELRKLTEIPTATFVHRQGFIGGAEDLKGVIAMARRAFFHNESARIPRI